MPLYLDNDGVLHTIAAIGCHTGADWLYHTLTLDLEDDTADVETEQSLGFLTVTRRGRAVTIRFNKTPGSAAILETDSYIDDVPYGKELPVNGLYGDYTRVFCGMAALCVFADTGGPGGVCGCHDMPAVRILLRRRPTSGGGGCKRLLLGFR